MIVLSLKINSPFLHDAQYCVYKALVCILNTLQQLYKINVNKAYFFRILNPEEPEQYFSKFSIYEHHPKSLIKHKLLGPILREVASDADIAGSGVIL